jgi:hypothetical protein
MDEREIDYSIKTCNIFDIPDANTLSCTICGITPERPALWIQLHDDRGHRKYDLVFRMVYLFDGPTQWRGAEFCLAPREDLAQALDSLGSTPPRNSAEYDEFLKHFGLFTVDTLHYRVRILASSAYISDGVPAEFRRG